MQINSNKTTPIQFDLNKVEVLEEKIPSIWEKYNQFFYLLIKFIALLGIILFWVYFPSLYQLLVESTTNVKPEIPSELNEIGDVYGSLNTLFSSLTLLIVMYSMFLQSKSNREISEATNKQMQIAEQNHQEQLKASRHATFTNMFHSLLQHKYEKFKQISVSTKDGVLSGCEVTNLIAKEFHFLVQKKWMDIDQITKNDVDASFTYCVSKITKGKGYYQVFNYFYIYESIFKLMENEDLTPEDKEYFKDLVRNSMEVSEQITILWIASFSPDHRLFLNNSGIFSFILPDDHIPFVKKFLSSSLFYNKNFVNRLNR